MICRFRKGLFLRLCKLLKIRSCFWRKIQGTYFKISALYFKIYGLYFLQQAMCVFSMPETGRNRCRFRETNGALVATHGFLGEFETETFAFLFNFVAYT